MRNTNRSIHRYLRFWGSDVAADVDDELRFHLDARTQELVEEGIAPEAARAQAIREFGDVQRARETVRAIDEQHVRRARAAAAFGDLRSDVRFALRALAKTPGFTIVVAITLALGIGVNSAVFSLASAFLFRPLPVPAGGELVMLGQIDANINVPHELSYPNYHDYAGDSTIFGGLAAYVNNTRTLNAAAEGDHAERLWIDDVSANYFSVLRLRPHIGRFFRLDEDQGALAHPVVVLSYAFWRRKYGGDSNVVGDTIRIAGHRATIIGVAPESFHGVNPILEIDAYAPFNQIWPGYDSSMRNRSESFVIPFGRLATGIAVAQARAAVRAKARQLAHDYPIENRGVDAVLVRETHARPALAVAGAVPTAVTAFMTLVALVLLVVCANVVNLLLVRTASRHRELAIRAALGASGWRLSRQLVVECVLLALAGSLGAVALTRWVTHSLATLHVAADVPLRWDIAPDWRVFGFTLALALATAIAAAVMPALHSARADAAEALKAGGRGTTVSQQRLRRGLVVAQVSVSLAVIVCATLFARSTANALRMNLGFRTDHVLMTSTRLGADRYTEARGRGFYAELLRRVAALPGVRSVSTAEHTPMGYNNETEHVYPEGTAIADADKGFRFFYNTVGRDYFRTMGMPLLAGREFTVEDDSAAARVAVVSRALADRFWPNEPVMGRRFRFGKDGPMVEIVGVAADAQYLNLGEPPRPFVYLPASQFYTPRITLVVHTAVDPTSLARGVRDIVSALDRELAVFDVRTMEDHLQNGRALLFVRLGALFAAAFGALTLALAALGVYGVMSYSVTQRTKEIGIRVALGARLSSVLGLVLGEGMRIVVLGLVLGLVAAVAVARLLSGLLYGVRVSDPVVFGGVAIGLGVVALAASYLPARRAAKVDPLVALRAE